MSTPIPSGEIRKFEDAIDEIVTEDVANLHIETLSDTSVWIGITHSDGSTTHVTIGSKSGRAAVEVKAELHQ